MIKAGCNDKKSILDCVLYSSCKSPDGKVYNYVGMGGHHKGRFYVTDINEFYRLYNNEIERGTNLYLLERHQPESVYILDVDKDIAYENNGDVNTFEVYSHSQVEHLVKVCNKLLVDNVHEIKEKNLSVFLLEKPAKLVKKDGNTRIKRGFHLHYPHLILDTKEQKIFNKLLIEQVLKEEVFGSSCPIDDHSSEVNWLLYGSKKPSDDTIINEPYKLSGWFNHEAIFDPDFDKLLNTIVLTNVKDNTIIENPPISMKMAISPFKRPSLQFKHFVKLPPTTTNPVLYQIDTNTNELSEEEYQTVEKLVDMLSDERCDKYILWFNVGNCIFSTTRGYARGLEIFDKWSQKSNHYSSNTISEKFWKGYKITSYGLTYLKSMAEKDSPEEYKNWKTKIISSQIHGKSDNDMAKLFCSFTENQFKFCGKSWFQFENGFWKEINDRYLGQFILTKFMDQIKVLLKSSHDDEVRKIYGDILGRLSMNSSVVGFASYLKYIFYDENFENELDSNMYLIGFQNGIYDLDLCQFRQGIPDDKISKKLGCEYIEYDDDSPEINQVKEIMAQYFPDEELRHYIMNIMCQVFIGNIFLKHLFVWVGCGDNGKTVFSTWFELMLGNQYCKKIPASILCSDKSSPQNASPQLVRIKGARLVFMDEPDPDHKMNSSIVKLFTGHDSISARDLYQPGTTMRDFNIPALFVLVCNKEPTFSNPDGAALNRLVICNFRTKFVSQNDYEETKQKSRHPVYLKEANYVEKLKKLTSALAFYLLTHWKHNKHVIKNLEIPDCIKSAKERYMADRNMCQKFIEYYYRPDTSKQANITEETLSSYNRYTKTNTSMPEFITILRSNGVALTNGEHGYQINGYAVKNNF